MKTAERLSVLKNLSEMWNGLLAALSLNLLFVWSVMAAGEAEGSLSGELKELFESTQNSVKLGAALVVALVTYFISVVKIKDIEEVPKDDPEEFEEAAAEAWQEEYSADLPRSLALRARKWAGQVATNAGFKLETLAQSTSVGAVAAEDRNTAAKHMASGLDLSPFEREKVVKDMADQGLSCERIVALSLSLILGKVSKLSLTANMKYGEDPALSDPAKQARKAGKKILSVIIKEKVFVNAASFFSDLARNYASDGMSVESSLVATWWAETSGCFSIDSNEQLFTYLEAYFEKYAGRGLPVTIDTILVTRIRNAAGGSSGANKKDLESAQKRISELEEKQKKQNVKLAELEAKVGKLKVKPSAEEQAERRSKVICNICKKKGHYASECPEREDKED